MYIDNIYIRIGAHYFGKIITELCPFIDKNISFSLNISKQLTELRQILYMHLY